jgi:hypothetical protein
MAISNIGWCGLLEVLVVLFQVAGVASLCINRFFSGTRWADRTRVTFILALLGLGAAGALCGSQDSEFALFAGGTITVLLIGMTIGTGVADASPARGLVGLPEANLVN